MRTSVIAGCVCWSWLLLVASVGSATDDVVWPMPDWPVAAPGEVGLRADQLAAARDYALTGGGSGCIVRHGRIVLVWGDPDERYDLKSSTKSFGATALGLAIGDGKIRLADPVRMHHPTFGTPPKENADTGWLDKIAIWHLATHTAGFEKPGGYTRLVFAPGSRWAYSDGGPNWLAECITLAYRKDLEALMFERVFTQLGITRDDLVWRKNSYRPATIEGIPRREFGSGIRANVDAMARIGYLYLRGGMWKGRRILPEEFVHTAGTLYAPIAGLPVLKPEEYGAASKHYGLLWWNNADGTLAGVPRDAFWSWGLYDSLIVVIPSFDLVVARAGRSWAREEGADHYDVLAPFLEPIAAAVVQGIPPATATSADADPSSASSESGGAATAPYPPSPVFRGIEWAPKETIVRKARGGDNWPLTWADDDRLYAAYGDGNGFKPQVPKKLSLGLARIEGQPDDFRGVNLRAPTAERMGGGRAGEKASGMLMVDGVLYMLVRNADNSQLAWSNDHGSNWTWSEWRFTESFGCPTFLQFGRNYAGARDEYVYIYSQDRDSAYERADRMVLARVPKREITKREAYEFFERLDDGGRPVWNRDVDRRGAVFVNPGGCYRSSVSHHAATGRYLWCQTGPGDDTRFAGGFGIYDAPEPWGPWTTVYFTNEWDVGPGETSSLPPKWMSDDGHTVHLVFSGDDHFSVRRATLTLAAADERAYRSTPILLQGQEEVLGVPDARGRYAQFREQSALLIDGGRLLVTAQAREASDWSDRSGQDLVCKWSDDLGESWSAARLIVAHGDHSIVPSAAVYDRATKRVHLLYNVFQWDFHDSESRKKLADHECRQFHVWSDDRGESWSQPRDVTEMIGVRTAVVVFGSGEGIQLRHGTHAGRLVVPGGHFLDEKHVLCYLSDDHGTTWRRGQSVPVPEGMHVLSETKVAELPDGTLILNNRATPHRRQARSTDGGQTWSKLRDVPEIEAVSCNGSLMAVPHPHDSDRVVLLCSAPAGPNRTHGTLWASVDRGETWSRRAMVVPEEFAYSSLVGLPDGRVALFYEARGHRDIRLIRLAVTDLVP